MSTISKSIQVYEKRFGGVAIGKGYITQRQLSEVLDAQSNEKNKFGTHRLLGEIFLDNDIMDANQIEDVVKTLLKIKLSGKIK